MRTVEIVTVEYKTDEIMCAVGDMLGAFYKNSEGTLRNQLPIVEATARRVIASQLPACVSWQTTGLLWEFAGFYEATKRVSDDGKITLESNIPQILLEEDPSADLTIDQKLELRELTNSAISKVTEDHPVELELGYPLSIVRFPIESFSTRVERMEIPLL